MVGSSKVLDHFQLNDHVAVIGRPVIPFGLGGCQAGDDPSLTEGVFENQRVTTAERGDGPHAIFPLLIVANPIFGRGKELEDSNEFN